MKNVLDINAERLEAKDKVTGKAKYTADICNSGILYAHIVASDIAHGLIKSIDTTDAQKLCGVKTVLTGRGFSLLTGALIEDRPALAVNKVRYYGEPVAIVIALTEHEAALGARLVKVEYEPLQTISKASDALKPDALIIHVRTVLL